MATDKNNRHSEWNVKCCLYVGIEQKIVYKSARMYYEYKAAMTHNACVRPQSSERSGLCYSPARTQVKFPAKPVHFAKNNLGVFEERMRTLPYFSVPIIANREGVLRHIITVLTSHHRQTSAI